MADGQVVFEIRGDNKPVKQVLSDTTRSIETEAKKWDAAVERSGKDVQQTAAQTANGMAGSFDGAFKAIAASAIAAKVVSVLREWGAAAIQAASDLEEVQNVVDVTFGESASTIEAWAKNASKQFGLTETQAKRFTSTIGAMAKSLGLAGPEIVEMSTDLAGLAADMASFYNLDFDTAFQKIRSGLSGETEPLKQLGINMSVANLQAYALSKGITTAFDKMSAGEQTMLRYQYMMEATADAQGDFARTSDGYANGLRLLQTNIETLKTEIGKGILPIVSDVVAGVNDMFAALTQNLPQRTVLNDFADIDTNTDEKLAEIQKTANAAKDLIGVLDSVAEAGSKVQTSNNLTALVNTMTRSLGNLGSALDMAKAGDYTGTMSEIAKAMELDTGIDASKWETLLTAIASELPGATSATLSDDEQTAAWMAAAADAAGKLGGEYPELWGKMLKVLGDDAGDAISALAGATTANNNLSTLADTITKLKWGNVANWSAMLGALKSVGALDTLNTAGTNFGKLAKALAGEDESMTRGEAWAKLLGSLSENVETVSQLTGKDAEGTKQWLETLANAANTLDPNDAQGWDTLFQALGRGLSGGGESDEFFAEMIEQFLAMGNQSEAARESLLALGYSSEEIDDMQKSWLTTCKQLVATIPGLSEVINTETGEVQGGTDAIDDYVDAWRAGQEKIALWKAHYARREAYEAARSAEYNATLDRMRAEAAVNRLKKEQEELTKVVDEGERNRWNIREDGIVKAGEKPALFSPAWSEEMAEYSRVTVELHDAELELERATKAETKAISDNAAAAQMLDDEEAALTEQLGAMEQQTEDATDATEAFTTAQQTAATEGVTALSAALKELEQYYNNVRKATESTLEQTASGFKKVQTPAEQARAKMEDLTSQINKLNADGKDSSGILIQKTELEETIPTIGRMNDALASQIAFLDEYEDRLAQARALGFSDDVLAELADGSAESMDYLRALTDGTVTANGEQVQKLNEQYAEVAQKREALTKELTDQQLKADEEFDKLLQKANEAAEGLDVYDTAKSGMSSTVQGMIDGISGKMPTLQKEVDAIKAVLNQLTEYGYFTPTATPGTSFAVPSVLLNGEHATGLDYVPFDHYLASLHEGESILTAEEARIWRDFKAGGAQAANSIDYDTLHGAIWDGAPSMGGNVYLDGRTVGRIISGQQADSYRTLERSGWRG